MTALAGIDMAFRDLRGRRLRDTLVYSLLSDTSRKRVFCYTYVPGKDFQEVKEKALAIGELFNTK